MKRICFINPQSIYKSIGGAEVQIKILADQLSKENYQVYYITAPEEIPEYHTDDIHYIAFKETGNLANDIINFFEIADKIKPDIIYQRGRKRWTIYAGTYSIKRKIKFIFAASMDIDCYKFKFTFRKPRSFRDLYKKIKNIKRNYLLDKKSLNIIKSASIVLSQTNFQRYLLLSKVNTKSIQFPNIHASVNADNINKSERVNVLWIANIKKWKQPEIYLKLVEELKDYNCHFIMAGKLSDLRYKELILKTSEANQNFSYLGPVEFDKSNELIANASFFINTSDSEEGFPNTFIQSWLRKTPIISLNFDPDNLITNYKLGFVSNSQERLKAQTIKLITDKKLRNEIGERAFHFANRNYSIDKRFDDFLNIIKS